uniref:Uncharacterized protein n=1 Tax=Anguilla anguilla TaxID=7936 RepID=A0A0E9XK48_ANGAN
MHSDIRDDSFKTPSQGRVLHYKRSKLHLFFLWNSFVQS